MNESIVELKIPLAPNDLDTVMEWWSSPRAVTWDRDEYFRAVFETAKSAQSQVQTLAAKNAQLKAELASQSWTTDAGTYCNKHAFELMRLEPQMNDLLRNNKQLTKTILKIQDEIKYYKENRSYRGSPIDNITAIIDEYLNTKE